MFSSRFLLFIFLLILTLPSLAQVKPVPGKTLPAIKKNTPLLGANGMPAHQGPEPKNGTPINFTADKADFEKVNGKTIGHLHSTGNPCRFFQGNAIMTSDSAILFQDDNKLNAFGHVVIHQADTITITGDRLYYDGKTRVAQLYDHITMTDRQGVLTTNHLNYDLNTKIGTYYDGGRITNKDNILLSRTGYYYETTKVAYFKTKVTILTPQTTINSDTLQYNTLSRIAYFFGPTRITGKDDFIYCENGEYNTATDQAKFSRHAYYLNGSKRLSGDSLYYDKRKGYGRAVRNVFFRDSVEKAYLYGGIAVYNKSTEITYATIKPLFIFITNTQDTINEYPDSLIQTGKPGKKGKEPIDKLKSDKALTNQTGSIPNKFSPKGKVILDTLITENSDTEKTRGDKKSGKAKTVIRHLVRSVVDKVDSLFLTADTLKTELATGDRAKPHLFISKVQNLKKTRFDSLDKKAGELLNEIRQDVIQDSLKKLPGYKAPVMKKPVNKGLRDSLNARKNVPITPFQMDRKGKTDSLGLKLAEVPKVQALSQSKSLPADSLPRKKPRKGFFARIFAFFNKDTSVPVSADSLARRRDDSLNRRAKIHIPYLLEGIPENSDSLWSRLFQEGKKRAVHYEDTAHYRIIFAYRNARMYKSDFQSAADSMVYTYFDSTIRCFKHPILWTEGSQMSADTISLSMKNQKLDSLAMLRSAFIISQVDSLNRTKFNQMSGRDMYGRFKNNNLNRLRVDGNGKSLYYAEEEKTDSITRKTKTRIIGLNTSIASYFKIYFKKNRPERIVSVESPEHKFYPLLKVPAGKERLGGFNWRDSERPKSRNDIFRKPSIQDLAQDSLVNKKSAKADSTDDASPNILDIPKPPVKKAKPRNFSSPSPPKSAAYFPKRPSFGLMPWLYEKSGFFAPGTVPQGFAKTQGAEKWDHIQNPGRPLGLPGYVLPGILQNNEPFPEKISKG